MRPDLAAGETDTGGLGPPVKFTEISRFAFIADYGVMTSDTGIPAALPNRLVGQSSPDQPPPTTDQPPLERDHWASPHTSGMERAAKAMKAARARVRGPSPAK